MELRRLTDRELIPWYEQELTEAFPPNERKPFGDILALMDQYGMKVPLEKAAGTLSVGEQQKLEIIKGEVTSPINPKPGCRFADRCPYATDKCREDGLKLQEISKGHFVACRLHEK